MSHQQPLADFTIQNNTLVPLSDRAHEMVRQDPSRHRLWAALLDEQRRYRRYVHLVDEIDAVSRGETAGARWGLAYAWSVLTGIDIEVVIEQIAAQVEAEVQSATVETG